MKIRTVIAAVLTAAILTAACAFLTGCGCNKTSPTESTAASAAPSAAASTAAQESTAASSARNEDSDDSQSSTSGDPNAIGISRDEAVANVLSQCGDDAEVLSVEEGTSTEGFPCYVVTVSDSSGSDPVVYFSGYLFCYAENYDEEYHNNENDNPEEPGISYSEVVKNVLLQAGDSAEILSAEEGTSPDGLPCWVITVSPVTNTDEAKTITYYSGYLFCYAEQ